MLFYNYPEDYAAGGWMYSLKYLLAAILISGLSVNPLYASYVFDELYLVDVQPNIGGHRLIIRASGEYEVTIVKPSRSGKYDQEYTGQLDAIDVKRIKKAFKASKFITMKLPASKKSNSAAGPVIEVTTNGNTISKQKMTGVRHKNFDELYGTLLAIINKIKRKKALSSDLDIPVIP